MVHAAETRARALRVRHIEDIVKALLIPREPSFLARHSVVEPAAVVPLRRAKCAQQQPKMVVVEGGREGGRETILEDAESEAA